MPHAPHSSFSDFLAGNDVHCPACRYNLRGTPGVQCPECGLAVSWGAFRAHAYTITAWFRAGQGAIVFCALEGFAVLFFRPSKWLTGGPGALAAGVLLPLLSFVLAALWLSRRADLARRSPAVQARWMWAAVAFAGLATLMYIHFGLL